MKKVTLIIKETLVYDRHVEVEIPDDMDEKSLNKALDIAQHMMDGVDEMIHKLEKYGIKQTQPYDTSMNSPDSVEIECSEYDFVD